MHKPPDITTGDDFGIAEIPGGLVRSNHGFLLYLSGSEADLVGRLTEVGDDVTVPLAPWLSADSALASARAAALPGLLAKNVVRIILGGGEQCVQLAVPPRRTDPNDPPRVTGTCPECLRLRLRQADVLGALIRARGGQMLLHRASTDESDDGCSLTPDPRCQRCRPSQAAIPRPVPKQPRTSGATVLSTSWRDGAPGDVSVRLESLVEPRVGLIAGLRRAAGMPADIAVWFAGPNRALSTAHPSGLTWRTPGNAMGKGATDEEARTSALAEAAERWSGTWQQADQSPWLSGWHLADGSPARIPTERVLMGVPPVDGRVLHTDANGLAAGTSTDDALLQALLEVIERDAIARWWKGDTDSAPLDPGDDQLLDTYLDWLSHMGVACDVRLLDAAAGVTVVLALGTVPHTSRRLYGAGAHVDARIAYRRAIFELVQSSVAARITGRQLDPRCGFDPGGRSTLQRPTAANRRLDLSTTSDPGIGSALTGTVRQLEAAGFSPIGVDLTRPEIGVPVVKVLVAGFLAMPQALR